MRPSTLASALRKAARALLGRPPSDWAGPDEALSAVLRASPPPSDCRHEIVLFPSDDPLGERETDEPIRRLVAMGHRVYRISGRSRARGRPYEIREKTARLFEVSIRDSERAKAGTLSGPAPGAAVEALDALRHDAGFGATVSVVRHPGWLPAAEALYARCHWPVVRNWPDSGKAGGRDADSSGRSPDLSDRLERAFPKISVVVVTFNNRDLNRLCLESLFARTEWPNLEVIVVDNASSDGTLELLADLERKNANLYVTALPENRGFPAACNAGLAASSGAYLVLLNNDTVLTRGWATALVRHLAADPGLGLVGPVTNAIANEARVDVGYANLAELPGWAERWVRGHDGEIFPIPMLAFFCVAMRRDVFEKVGPLDERFGVGLFEDGDYSRRVLAAGWRIRCARDAFVHHWQMASFRKLGRDAYLELFDENRRKYEEKWGGP